MRVEKIAVTGANGFVGSHVVRELLHRGKHVSALVLRGSSMQNLLPQLDHPRFSIVEGDVRSTEALNALLKDASGVIHAAAYNQLWSPNTNLPIEINVEGTRSLLEVCSRFSIPRVIHISTATLFQNPEKEICDETDFLQGEPNNCYERSKWMADNLVFNYAEAGHFALSISPTVPVGPGDLFLTAPGRLILDFLNRRIPAYLKTGLNVIDVRVLAKTICNALERGRSGEKYIVGGRNIFLKDFFAILEEISGAPAPKFRIPYAVAWATSLVGEVVATRITKKAPRAPLEGVRLAKRPCFYSSEKAIGELGLGETAVNLALQDEIEFYQQHHMVIEQQANEARHLSEKILAK